MRRTLLPLLFALIAALPVTAQSTGQPVVAEAFPDGVCPTMISAQYVPGAALRLVQPGSPEESRKPLHLAFGPADNQPQISQAVVTVRGITEKGGVIPAGTMPASPWLERTLSVKVATNAAGLLSGTGWLSGFGGVSDVRVDSITYASGRVWRSAASESCHARVGGVMTSSR